MGSLRLPRMSAGLAASVSAWTQDSGYASGLRDVPQPANVLNIAETAFDMQDQVSVDRVNDILRSSLNPRAREQ